jgi:CheY-like chemotaxis protein
MILVVDDQVEVRQMIVRMLHHAGFDAIDAGDGHEALTLLTRGLNPSAIVLDLWMPIMDGWEFLERAKPSMPVIVISGITEGLHALPGCVAKLLKKPISIEELVAAIKGCRIEPSPSAQH